MYIYIYTYMHICIYIYIYIYKLVAHGNSTAWARCRSATRRSARLTPHGTWARLGCPTASRAESPRRGQNPRRGCTEKWSARVITNNRNHSYHNATKECESSGGSDTRDASRRLWEGRAVGAHPFASYSSYHLYQMRLPWGNPNVKKRDASPRQGR